MISDLAGIGWLPCLAVAAVVLLLVLALRALIDYLALRD